MDDEVEAPSPFLPGTHIQFAWDSTSLELIKRCPRLYQYTMIDGWQAKHDNIHLRFGQELHQAFHDYELAKAKGQEFEDALRQTVHLLLKRIHSWDPDPNIDKQSEKNKSKGNLVRSVIWYIDKFKDDPAETIMMKDGRPGLEVSFRFELDWGPRAYIDTDEQVCLVPGAIHYVEGTRKPNGQPYLLCGHLDRIVSYQGSTFVMDRKTTTTTPGSYFFQQFEPHNQMTLYTLAGQVVLDVPIRSVIIDAIQIGMEFTRPVRGFTYRTPAQLEEWIKDLEFWLSQAEDFAEAGYWPMNDTSCSMYGGCKFRGICSKDPGVRERFLEGSFVKGERWNPLRVR